MKAKATHLEHAQEIYRFIRENDHFLLTAHINADGDAVASVIAVGQLLEALGKKFYMVLSDQSIDSKFDYLRLKDQIHSYNENLNLPVESAIVLDVPSLSRIGETRNLLPAREKVVKIDHHPVEDDFAAINMVDTGASSTTQLVYEIVEHAGIGIDKSMAAAIYTGIVYDTGRFSFSNTTSRDMYIGARMIDLGVEPSEITNRLFFENSFEALRTIGQGLANMECYLDGLVNVIYLDQDAMQRNHQGEIEELANYSVAIRGGKIGLFVREVKPGFHKVSLRSKCDVDVNQVAKAFDGGGHAKASGCRIDGNKEEVVSRLIAEIEKHL